MPINIIELYSHLLNETCLLDTLVFKNSFLLCSIFWPSKHILSWAIVACFCVKCIPYSLLLSVDLSITHDCAEERPTFSREGWVIIKKRLWCQASKMPGKTLFSSLMRTSNYDLSVSASIILRIYWIRHRKFHLLFFFSVTCLVYTHNLSDS